jgi:hypothetical protein
MRRTLRTRGSRTPGAAPEGGALTHTRTGCSNPLYRAAGGAVAKERAGGMQPDVPDSAWLACAGSRAGRTAPGVRR